MALTAREEKRRTPRAYPKGAAAVKKRTQRVRTMVRMRLKGEEMELPISSLMPIIELVLTSLPLHEELTKLLGGPVELCPDGDLPKDVSLQPPEGVLRLRCAETPLALAGDEFEVADYGFRSPVHLRQRVAGDQAARDMICDLPLAQLDGRVLTVFATPSSGVVWEHWGAALTLPSLVGWARRGGDGEQRGESGQPWLRAEQRFPAVLKSEAVVGHLEQEWVGLRSAMETPIEAARVSLVDAERRLAGCIAAHESALDGFRCAMEAGLDEGLTAALMADVLTVRPHVTAWNTAVRGRRDVVDRAVVARDKKLVDWPPPDAATWLADIERDVDLLSVIREVWWEQANDTKQLVLCGYAPPFTMRPSNYQDKTLRATIGPVTVRCVAASTGKLKEPQFLVSRHARLTTEGYLGYWHPHAGQGRVCWGGYSRPVGQASERGDFMGMLHTADVFIANVTPTSSYLSILRYLQKATQKT